MRHASCPKTSRAGFTLIELVIVVGVVGVLALIAYPAFQDVVRKSRRADAVAGLNQLQLLQERVRGQQPSYADSVASMPGAPGLSPERHYVLAVNAASATGYRMTATASNASPQYADTKCRGMRVEMAGGTVTYSSLNAAGDVDTTNANRCWSR
jgi:type IV pilus assembly protein PilE